MSYLISPFSADERAPEHINEDLYDMVLWNPDGSKCWDKALTHKAMEDKAIALADKGWVVVDIREQYMCNSEDNESNINGGFAQVYMRDIMGDDIVQHMDMDDLREFWGRLSAEQINHTYMGRCVMSEGWKARHSAACKEFIKRGYTYDPSRSLLWVKEI